MTGLVVVSSPADQGGPQEFAKELLIAGPLLLESCTWINKGASAAYIQFFDIPRKATAMTISDTDEVTGVITVDSTAGYQNGDKVTFTSIVGLTTHFINVVSATEIKAYSTVALALAGGAPDVLPTNPDDTGSAILASLSVLPVCEEYPVAAAEFAPSNVGSLVNARFKRGLYIRAVTAVNGSTLISGDDVKFTPRYRKDVIKNVAYEI